MKRYVKCSNENIVFKNYGDVNFLDGGCVVASVPNQDGCYYVIRCNYVNDVDDDRRYLLEDCYVDIYDSWIDADKIEESCECNRETDPELFADACVWYYGGENFGANSNIWQENLYMTAEEVEQYMSGYNLPSDIYFDAD